MVKKYILPILTVSTIFGYLNFIDMFLYVLESNNLFLSFVIVSILIYNYFLFSSRMFLLLKDIPDYYISSRKTIKKNQKKLFLSFNEKIKLLFSFLSYIILIFCMVYFIIIKNSIINIFTIPIILFFIFDVLITFYKKL